jgi:hypothetical protein
MLNMLPTLKFYSAYGRDLDAAYNVVTSEPIADLK